MLMAQSDSPSQQLMGVLDFRLESFQQLLTGELMPGERRAKLIRRRRDALVGDSSPLLGGDDAADLSATQDVPENVSVEDGAPDEAIEVAAAHAEDFAEVTVSSNGAVRGQFHGAINSQTLREPDIDQTVSEGNKSMTERQEVPVPDGDSSSNSTAGPPSMSEAGAAKQRQKRDVRSDGGHTPTETAPEESTQGERSDRTDVDGIN